MEINICNKLNDSHKKKWKTRWLRKLEEEKKEKEKTGGRQGVISEQKERKEKGKGRKGEDQSSSGK